MYIFHDPFFPNDFFNLLLGLLVERIGVQQSELSLLFGLNVTLILSHVVPDLPKAERVGHGIRQLRILRSELGEDVRGPQRL